MSDYWEVMLSTIKTKHILRIIELCRLEGNSICHLVQLLVQSWCSYSRLFRAMSGVWKSTSMEFPQHVWDPVPPFDHFQDSFFTLISNRNFPCPLPLIPLLCTFKKRPALSFLYPLTWWLKTAKRSPKPSFCHAEQMQLNRFPGWSHAPSLWQAWWPPVDSFQYVHIFVNTGEPKTGLCTPDIVSQVVNRVEGSFPYTCWLLSH